uniref:Wsv390-like protein, paralog 3 n=1 Tax=Sesarmops intermedium nimavirus TaxID=2133796 RepID=A0A401IPT0_9VIRU|nr:MAG: wsv390-like protein [Sesarmops intermedium nimavirus]BDT63473.1 MAG: wsv390-like protein [Sesarmops intermedium nimavirus]GBG35628.1 wsv390-like protein, paralog 3 [Sesarmops intermedium nimavirus]
MEAKLGQEYFLVGSSPKLSLVASKEWCSRIRVDKERGTSSSVAVPEFFQKYGVFEALLSKRKPPSEVVEHFDIVTFSKKNDDPLDAVENQFSLDAVENQFGFLIDNKEEEEQYAVAYIYSLQDKKIVFNGFAVSPTKKSRLMRYDTDDRAFCLTANSTILEEDTTASKRTARQIFEDLRDTKKGVCAFSIMLTRARQPRGMLVETDGTTTDVTDGPSSTQQHYTNLVEGSKTNQRFTPVAVDYDGAPVHIYNVVLFMDQPKAEAKFVAGSPLSLVE